MWYYTAHHNSGHPLRHVALTLPFVFFSNVLYESTFRLLRHAVFFILLRDFVLSLPFREGYSYHLPEGYCHPYEKIILTTISYSPFLFRVCS